MSSGQLLIPIKYLEVPLPAACILVWPPFWNKSAPLSTIRNFTHCWNYFTQALLVYCQTAPTVIQRAVSVSVQRDVSATNHEVSGADLVPASSFLHSLFSKRRTSYTAKESANIWKRSWAQRYVHEIYDIIHHTSTPPWPPQPLGGNAFDL